MESQFSNQVDGSVPNQAPHAPIIERVQFSNGLANLYILLPKVDDDGGPLTGLSHCYVFYKDTPFDASTPAQERELGTPCVITPVTPPLPDGTRGGQAEPIIHVTVPGLVYGKTYYFVASCDD